MKTLYPEIEPFKHFFLTTETKHAVYVEQSGNPNGLSVLFLHGGPCSGTKPDHRRYFNPEKYHIILMDQRGCGQSLPFGEIENNSTQDLIDDMEKIRSQLNIKQWLLFGGSWGSTLSLLYAQQHAEKVLAMIVRGVFLARQKDLEWFIKEGVNNIYPEKWQQLVDSIPEPSKPDRVKSLYEAVFGVDEITKRRVTRAWMNWGGQVALKDEFIEDDKPLPISSKMVEQVQMELHYAVNKYFIAENQILNDCIAIQHIPTIIIHGRNDLVCPMEAGMSLSKALPQAEYVILPHAGHIASSPDMIDALVNATDKMLKVIQ